MSLRWLVLGCLAACATPAPAPIHPASVRQGTILTEDSVQLAFRVEGDAADTVVVLHGGPGLSGESLRPDLGALAADFTLIFYDQRGSGHSTPITNSSRISVAHHVADLEAVRRHFGLERMVLAGHSWGGGLALHYAAAHPQHTERMLLIDPIPLRRDPYMGQFGRNLRAWMDSTTRVAVSAAARALASTSNPVAACRAYWALFIRGYLADPMGSIPVRGDPCDGTPQTLNNQVYQYTLGPLGAWDWRPDAQKVSAPALILHGEKSPLPVESFREWASMLPKAKLRSIVGSGHFPHAEQPALFIPIARAFLRGDAG
ncbi:MAG TPA: alpha/beta hydrolase [Longimicrobiaceae bacterium]|nr:alpha/beta hydrolase [Longimicrobiaceae bacterium]